MNKKYLGVGGCFIIGVLVFSLVANAGFFDFLKEETKGEIQKSPKTAPINTTIRANSCDADETCETDRYIQFSDGVKLESNDPGGLGIWGGRLGRPYNGQSLTFANLDPFDFHSLRFYFYAFENSLTLTFTNRTWEGSVVFQKSGNDFVIRDLYPNVPFTLKVVGGLRTTGNARIGGLAGNGTAYACVNMEGVLFRSQTPCV